MVEMKKYITIGVLALALIVSAFIYVPRYRFAQGHTYKVVESHGVQMTEGGGMAKYLTVQDNEGNTFEVRSGRIYYWSGMKSGNYVNKDLFVGGN